MAAEGFSTCPTFSLIPFSPSVMVATRYSGGRHSIQFTLFLEKLIFLRYRSWGPMETADATDLIYAAYDGWTEEWAGPGPLPSDHMW